MEEVNRKSENERLLRTQVLQKTDINPENAWGNNSYLLIRQKKIARKFNKIMEYIDIEDQDE